MSNNVNKEGPKIEVNYPDPIQKRIDDANRRRKALGWPPADYESGLQMMFLLMGGWPSWRKLQTNIPDIPDEIAKWISDNYKIYAGPRPAMIATYLKMIEMENCELSALRIIHDAYQVLLPKLAAAEKDRDFYKNLAEASTKREGELIDQLQQTSKSIINQNDKK